MAAFTRAGLRAAFTNYVVASTYDQADNRNGWCVVPKDNTRPFFNHASRYHYSGPTGHVFVSEEIAQQVLNWKMIREIRRAAGTV